ncbi:nucleotidyl transferase AbiEii/AbiGii toxin family protein [Candidatus Peregrinibacteria bacterium]|nr:nucleotidyl transferase AbiEii/AbiGii toxin family protein [Candidatus Peregrinibacteria bacterium]
MISKDQIHEFSKRFAIDEFTIMREYIQVVFLGALYGLKESHKIYFKGGTAMRLLLKSGRFSEDLDFTSELNVKELDLVVNRAVKKTNLLIPDVSIKRTDEKKMSYTGILSYHPAGIKYALNIHLDFSLREKPETSQDSVLLTDFPLASPPVIRHMNWPEILAEKIRAFVYRSKGRDIYDLWFLLIKGIDLDWEMINRKTKFYKISTSLEDVLRRVRDFDDKKLKNDMGKFLPAHDRGLVVHLKKMTTKELMTRYGFTVVTSENLDYTKIPGHSFPGTDPFINNIKQTTIFEIKRQDENSLVVKMKNSDDRKANAYIRAQSYNGVRELKIIETNADLFKGRSYDHLIHHIFKT